MSTAYSHSHSHSHSHSFQQKQFDYSNNNQTVKLGSRIITSLPLQIKKLDLDLEWSSDNKFPKGIQLNEHNGSIFGRVQDINTNIGTFHYVIIAEKHEIRYESKYTISIIQRKITNLQYPNGNHLILIKNQVIKSPIYPIFEGSKPQNWCLQPFGIYKGVMPDGLVFDSETGAFSGCAQDIGKTSWKITATNTQNSFDSNIVVINITRPKQELDQIKTDFSIPHQIFKPIDLQIAIQTFKPNVNIKLGIKQTGNVLRACGKTPTPTEIKLIFQKYCGQNTFTTFEQIEAMLNDLSDESINLKEIERIFKSIDTKKTGKISTSKFRQIMRFGNDNVEQSVINDIIKTIDQKHENNIDYHQLLDLYNRISFGCKYY